MPKQDVMSIKKPIIALLHLGALPGDPRWPDNGSMKQVVRQAAQDLENLQKGGVDAILFSNEFSLPYQYTADHVTSGHGPGHRELMGRSRCPMGWIC